MTYTEMSKLAPEDIRVWADLDAGHVIDMVDPDTQTTVINGKDADQVLSETPTAIELTLAEFLRWKASKQNTPIEWLMRDSCGNLFVVFAYHLSKPIEAKLAEFSEKDLSVSETELRNYNDILADQTAKFSLHNANLFYAYVMEQQQLTLDQRKAMKLYCCFNKQGDVPLLQLIGFENSNGKKIILQPYNLQSMVDALGNNLKRLGYADTLVDSNQLIAEKGSVA